MAELIGFLLVVDDEEFNRDMLSRRLEIEGYSVLCASNGAEALQRISEHDFDAVLLDAMMPLQNGYEVLAEIRRTKCGIELPVIMVTAKSQNEDVVNAFEVGANDYITKPINFSVALARIKCHVAGRKLSTRLRESEMRYSLSAQGANDGLWDWDLQTNRIHYSERWKSILGLPLESVSDSPHEWFSRVHAEDLPHVEKALAAHRAGDTPQFECEYRMRHQDESYRWVLTRGMAVRGAAGGETRMAGSQTDITRGKAADPLTGLPNRVLLMDHLNAAIEAVQGRTDACFAVLFIDLDRFKIINDSLGHLAGDELLVAVGRRLESCLRTTDIASRMSERCTVSRFGGDEFVILLKGLTEPANACLVASRILTAIAEPLSLQGHDVMISASIGIAIATDGAASADDLLRDADTAMYRAKSDGKSQWCLFDQALRTQAVERLSLEADLKKGLGRNEFIIHYQPIVELPEQHVKGFEALLRWQHPTRGMISPIDFIPITEEIGLIVELGAWVLRQACCQIRKWQLEFPELPSLYISVNVSAKQFADPRFVDMVTECLRETGLQPQHLKLEITESAIVTNPQSASKVLERLRAHGIHISLDDFGTGYSSLSYLQNFKMDTLKIDRSFVSRLNSSDESAEIVRTIVNLAHSLGMEVVAEGVEDSSKHSHLESLGCESGQGYLYSRPLSVAGIEDLLQEETVKQLLQLDLSSVLASGTSPLPEIAARSE
jgi:diguanylate cyclase (GGDEF)-like protein/PAS domain S-box-containing protein